MQCALVPYYIDLLSYESVQDAIWDREPTCDVDFDDTESVKALAVLMSEEVLDSLFDYLDDNFISVIADLVEVKQ